MVEFTDVHYDKNFIKAKAYHPSTKKSFHIEFDINAISCKITPEDYPADIMMASSNIYMELQEKKFLPEKITVMWG